ncbi:MAG: aspartate kinase [Muribaculaceae bacterium]|nr:aspartate kinase [Muribaculaceae bacterium]MBR5674722.1 aspartate kinase [Muribaculaceae bacterium]
MKVMKFGGTSVGSVESLLNLRDIVNAESKPVIVVVSAMGGFTNQLLAMCEQAQQRDISCLDTLEEARKRHHDAVDGVVIPAMRDQVHATIDRFIDESLKPYYLALATNPHMPVDEIERVCDAIVAHGEILSSAIVTGMFEDGVPHLSLNFMRTTPDAGGRVLDWEETEHLVKADFASLDEGVHVVQGFISRDKESGAVTNLGRGGSDYTGAILASLLDADSLEIWTDVDGFMTADPRTHPDATVIPQMTYAQAQEMCDAGAKVIYPPTIAPVAMKHIPVWVKNTFNPSAPGTVIVDE